MLTRTELLDRPERERIRDGVMRYAPQTVWTEATHAPESLEAPSGGRHPLEALAGRSVAMFCGIGNPGGFRGALSACGYQVVAAREFADHYSYTDGDLAVLAAWADQLDVAAVICTGKDLVKIADRWRTQTPLFALRSRLKIPHRPERTRNPAKFATAERQKRMNHKDTKDTKKNARV